MKYLIFALILSIAQLPAEQLPEALKKGDLIALVFPASYLDRTKEEAKEIINRKAKWLESRGFRTILYPRQISAKGYLAGTDAERARALMDAWKNPDVKAIWCFRGGYGTPRMLHLLDYEYIKTHPKIFIGMSDITALHQAIQKKTGMVTFLGPVLNYFGDKDSNFDEAYAFNELEDILIKKRTGKFKMAAQQPSMQVLRSGKGKGKLVGGNLSLVASLCGTKWQIDTRDKVLVLEDVGEEIFRIDRMLWQLQEAGLLDRPAAVILGTWYDCRSDLKNSLTLEQVFSHYFAKAKYPVIRGFPTGHDSYQTTLPLNATVEVDTAGLTVRMVEAAVE